MVRAGVRIPTPGPLPAWARLRSGRRPGATGQSLVEFALVFPLVMLIMVMALDFGRAVYTLNAVGNAAREGTRTAIVDQFQANVVGRAAAQATALGISTSATCAGADWSATPPVPATPSGSSGVCVEYRTGDMSGDCGSSLGVGCVAVVTVKSTFTPLTPIVGQFVTAIPIVSTSKQPIESLCGTSGCPVP